MVEKFNRRKTIAIRAAFLARMLWIPIIVMAFKHSENHFSTLLHGVIIFVIGYHLIAAISGVSWLSWMSLIVPLEIRGRFFGLRNAILGAANIIFTLVGGRFLDWYAHAYPNSPQLRAFEILFSFAVICGFLSLIFLSRQHEPINKQKSQIDFKGLYHSPFKQTNFKKLIRFAVAWSFVVNMASPFFLIYMLQVLKLNYVTVATLVVGSAFADLVGMWVWGHVCDKLGHRPIMIIASIVASLLPIIWFFTGKNFASIYILIPLLHFTGGFSGLDIIFVR
jgi:MFS family permease